MSVWQRVRSLLRWAAINTGWKQELAEQQRELKADVAATRRDVEAQARYRRMQQQGGGQ